MTVEDRLNPTPPAQVWGVLGLVERLSASRDPADGLQLAEKWVASYDGNEAPAVIDALELCAAAVEYIDRLLRELSLASQPTKGPDSSNRRPFQLSTARLSAEPSTQQPVQQAVAAMAAVISMIGVDERAAFEVISSTIARWSPEERRAAQSKIPGFRILLAHVLSKIVE